MPDLSLEIMMKLLSDLHGEAEIKEALARVKQSTEDAADGSERLAEAHGKASEEGEKMEISHRAIHQVLHLIAHESGPGAGAAIAGLAAAGTGSIMLLVMSVKELVEWFNKAGESFDRLREKMASADASLMDAVTEATRKAADNAEDYALSLEKANTALTESERHAQLLTDKLNNQFEVRSKILAQEEEIALAEAKKTGASEEQLAAIQQEFSARKSALETSRQSDELQVKSSELGRAQANAPRLREIADAENANLGRLTSNANAVTQTKALKSAGEEMPELLKAAFAAAGLSPTAAQATGTASRENIMDALTGSRNKLMADAASKGPGEVIEKSLLENQSFALDTAIKKLKENYEYQDALNKSLAQHDKEVKEATKYAEDAKRAYEENQKAITALNEAVVKLSGKVNATAETGAVTQGLQLFQQAADATRGGTMTPQQAQLVQQIAEVNTGQAMSLQQAATYVQGMMKNTDILVGVLEAHARQMANLESRINALNHIP